MKFALTLCFAVSASAVAACPAPRDASAELDRIYAQLLRAPSAQVAQQLTGALWTVWLDAPDEKAQRMLDQGMSLRAARDYQAADRILTELVVYCPDYAEGYNQRAFARYLSGNMTGALPDLEQTLALRPRHLGALSGKALTHIALDEVQPAIALIRRMVRLNPWARERDMIEGLGTQL